MPRKIRRDKKRLNEITESAMPEKEQQEITDRLQLKAGNGTVMPGKYL